MKTSIQNNFPIRIGISSCLLGEKVRYDAGHKKDIYLTDILGKYFEWVPVCPELEVGMGVPREPVRLTGQPHSPRMIGTESGTDWTERMLKFSERRVDQLEKSELSGYIFKSKSPSCGIERVRIYTDKGVLGGNGTGLFAAALMKSFPLLPVEEEGRLNDAGLRDNFIVRVFSYHRLQILLRNRFTIGALVQFHTSHKYLSLAHSPKHYNALGKLVAAAKSVPPSRLRDEYSSLFMEALKVKTTTKKNVNVLQHIFGFLKKYLSEGEKTDILGVLEDYRKEIVPLIVPVTLLRNYLRKNNVSYLLDQVYLNPHPKELMLRNHV
ncbi:MAG: YbgA family protein [Bacteroidota bacterium]